MAKNKDSGMVVHSDNYPVVSEEVRKEIANKHKRVSQTKTPKHFVKKKYDGMEYCEISYMKSIAEEEFTPWNWEIIGKEVLGTEAYVVHGRLTYTDANGVVRIGDMVAAHRIQKKRGTNEFVDIGNDIKAANTDCIKKAFNMYLNICDDVYKAQIEETELTDEQRKNISIAASKLKDKDKKKEVMEQIEDGVINALNYKASMANLERLVNE